MSIRKITFCSFVMMFGLQDYVLSMHQNTVQDTGYEERDKVAIKKILHNEIARAEKELTFLRMSDSRNKPRKIKKLLAEIARFKRLLAGLNGTDDDNQEGSGQDTGESTSEDERERESESDDEALMYRNRRYRSFSYRDQNKSPDLRYVPEESELAGVHEMSDASEDKAPESFDSTHDLYPYTISNGSSQDNIYHDEQLIETVCQRKGLSERVKKSLLRKLAQNRTYFFRNKK